jgi:hypothetical protein
MLLEKLLSIVIVDQCHAIIASLLYDWKFFVVFRTVIPQVGIGSAVLFNFFVRNLLSVILFAKLFQYADDCVLNHIIY